MLENIKREVIIACDFSSKEDVYAFLAKMGDAKPYLKIGMELFYKEGPEMVRELKERGYKIFLDLKLHDPTPFTRRCAISARSAWISPTCTRRAVSK